MNEYMISYRFGEKKDIEELPPILPDIRTRGLYPGDYGKYTSAAWMKSGNGLLLMAKKLAEQEKPADWVIEEQKKNNVPVHWWSHETGAVETRDTFRPPFHVQAEYPFLCNKDFLESVWILNEPHPNLFGQMVLNPTRELDLSESGKSWKRRVWFADHFGGENYANRKAEITHLILSPRGRVQMDLFVYPDHAERYLNGHLVKVTEKDLDYEYRIIATLIVNFSWSGNINWKINKLAIKKL